MRTSALLLLFCCALTAAESETPYQRIAKLASFLSDGDSVSALESFDKQSADYGAIERDLSALTAQDEILCAIDLVEDKDAEDAKADLHHLDLDWYMTLKSRADSGPVERRRERVQVTVRRAGAGWKITALSPESILTPAAIR